MKFIYENLNEDTFELEEKDVNTLLGYILEDLTDLRVLMKARCEHHDFFKDIFKDIDITKYNTLLHYIEVGNLYKLCKNLLSDIKRLMNNDSISGMNLSAIFEEGEADYWECTVQDPDVSAIWTNVSYVTLKSLVDTKLNKLKRALNERNYVDNMIRSIYNMCNRINTSGCEYLVAKTDSKIAELAKYAYNCHTHTDKYLVFEKKSLILPRCEQVIRQQIGIHRDYLENEINKIEADLEFGYDVVCIIEEHTILGLRAKYWW